MLELWPSAFGIKVWAIYYKFWKVLNQAVFLLHNFREICYFQNKSYLDRNALKFYKPLKRISNGLVLVYNCPGKPSGSAMES